MFLYIRFFSNAYLDSPNAWGSPPTYIPNPRDLASRIGVFEIMNTSLRHI